MSAEGRARLAQVFDSAPYKTWAALSPIDARKVQDEFAGKQRPSASSKFAAGLIGLCRQNPPIVPPAPPKTELVGFVREVSHIRSGSEKGRAFAAAGGDKVLLQFADPATDATNRAELVSWQAGWHSNGIGVEGWWRVNHTPDNRPTVAGITAWWPNAETDQEVARLPVIYRQPGVVGVVTLGKKPGLPISGPIAIECFRETPSSDATVTNCVRFWNQSGVPTDQLIVMLQGYGTPFSPPVAQCKEALALGVRRLALYPLDGFPAADITMIGKLLEAAG